MQISTTSLARPHRTKPPLPHGHRPSPLTRPRQPPAADRPLHLHRRHAAAMSGCVVEFWFRFAMAASAPKSHEARYACAPSLEGRLCSLFPSVNVSQAL